MCTCIWGSWSWKEWSEWLSEVATNPRGGASSFRMKGRATFPGQAHQICFLCNLFGLSGCWQLSLGKSSPNTECPSPLNQNHNLLFLAYLQGFSSMKTFHSCPIQLCLYTKWLCGRTSILGNIFLQKSVFAVEAVDSLPFCPLKVFISLSTGPVSHLLSQCPPLCPASLCLRTFSGHKNPLCLCTGQTKPPGN